ncbi:MAG: TonB-dependent receptor, partial [Ignavibacteriaceae bacterium]|nr:TonB-dependent receptor [Ignavibacteriaceae bacterium]
MFFINITSVYSQNEAGATISGYIYNSRGEALFGADIHIDGTHKGATTNLIGFFAIRGVDPGEKVILASFVGYKNQSRKLNVKKSNNEVIKIYLEDDIIEKQEVIIRVDPIRSIEKRFLDPISFIELNTSEINNIPRLVEADLFRSLQTIPGVQPISDFSSSLYIRGGTPDQNLYLVDGTEVYNPEHAFGLFSVFNTSVIKNVEFSKGGFGAEYGGHLSSVLNVTNMEGNRNNFKADVDVNLISAAATFEAPLGSIGSVSGSFRRTFIDQTYAKVIKEIPDYYFYDGNLKAYFDLGEKDKLSLSFFGGRDKLNYVFDKSIANSVSFQNDWGNTTAGINWIRVINPDLVATFWATVSGFSSNFYFPDVGFVEKNDILDYSIKGNFEYFLNKELSLKAGFENKIISGLLNEQFPGDIVNIGMHRDQYSGYITSNYRPYEMLAIEAGLRYDFFRSDKDYQNLDPRFVIKYKLNGLSNIKFSAGIYHQYLNRIPRLFLTSIWTSADKNTLGSSANHFILSYQRDIEHMYTLDLDLYYKRYFNIYSFNQNYLSDIVPEYYDSRGEPIFTDSKGLYDRGDSKSLGLEIMLRKEYGYITGWLGYTYSLTKTETDGINNNQYYYPRQDRTHTINAIANVNINDFISSLNGKQSLTSSSKWTLGINFIYATGQPITVPNSTYYFNQLPDWDNSKFNVSLFPSEINSVRLPPYIRMDVNLTWEKNYDNWTLSPYLQIFNVGNRKNTWF